MVSLARRIATSPHVPGFHDEMTVDRPVAYYS